MINNRSYFSHIVLFVCLIYAQLTSAQQLNINVAKINRQLKALETENHLSGVILIAKNGKPIYKKAFGFANLPDSIRNKTTTRFNLASMNKMFTGMAIMQLMESGKIFLHDNVGK